ncbi:ferredoxin Fer [Halorussus halobius]|uniref:ferredoxin Fer n=1 Tax=Halorussus halobius TaxID=1710537 RepID=UPI00109254EA|nr:ferredoxin Fer [Halorussus halobius]
MESPFDVLSVDPDADEEAVEQAYRERVKRAHPDQGGSVEEFRRVRRAYERIESGDWDDERAPASDADGAERDRGPSDRTASDRRSGDPAASDRTGADRTASDPDGADRARDRRITSEVTYLDYDVLADFGWDVDDEDLFDRASAADLDATDFGRFRAEPGESLLEAAEERGFAWPFACRGGACANCAVLVRDGAVSMPSSHVLPDELVDRGIRLSCNGIPITDELNVVYNVKGMSELDDLLLPPDPFENRYADD